MQWPELVRTGRSVTAAAVELERQRDSERKKMKTEEVNGDDLGRAYL